MDTRRRPHSHCCRRVRMQLCMLQVAPQAAHYAHCRVGVLALPYSFSYLTWGGGPLLLVCTCLTSLYTSFILAAMHQTETGARYNSYPELGRGLLGACLLPSCACCLIIEHLWSAADAAGPRLGFWAVVPFQFSCLIGLDITYMVTAGQSLQVCSRSAAAQSDSCFMLSMAPTRQDSKLLS